MGRDRELSPAVRAIIVGAGVIILFGGMKLASEILSPTIFAICLAVLCAPIVRSLQLRGLPTWAALLVLIVGMLALLVALTAFTFLSLSQVRHRLPEYQAQLALFGTQLRAWLARFDIDLATANFDLIDPATVINAAASVIRQTVNGVILALLILVGVVFSILESDRFAVKLRHGLGNDNPLLAQLARFSAMMQQFFYLRTINNLIVAAGAAIFLLVMQIDLALAWAVLIFFLSYIPNIGIILACVPAVALALLQYGLVPALVVVGGLTAINYIGDWALTPRLMSAGLGLSQFTVFLSFFVWAYIFGPVGGLLSVPLTLLLKLLLETSDDTRWLAVLMDDKAPAASSAPLGTSGALDETTIVRSDARPGT